MSIKGSIKNNKKNMKKLIISIMFASCAIQAIAINASKISAIRIDTILVTSHTIEIEYEVLTPFDRVDLYISAENENNSKDAQPLAFTGNSGKCRKSVPINLIVDRPTYINVLIAGNQFISKSDSAAYTRGVYQHLIVKRLADNSIYHYRSQLTPEERLMLTARRDSMIYFNREGLPIDGNGTALTGEQLDNIKESGKRFTHPLSIYSGEVKFLNTEMPSEEESGIQRAGIQAYNIQISGNLVADLPSYFGFPSIPIAETAVYLFFINSNSPAQLNHPKAPNNNSLIEGTHFAVTDHNGNFSFNFQGSADFGNLNQIVLLVTKCN
jgi:hypothetical protein